MMARLKPVHAQQLQPTSEEEERERLHPLAADIRIAYIMAFRSHYQARHGVPSNFGSRLVPRWDGGEGPDGKHYKPIWYKIARVALDAQVSPDDLIQAAFAGWDRKDPPLPTNLISEEVVNRALANPEIKADAARTALEVQGNVWKLQAFLYAKETGCDEATAAAAALRNKRLELSAIFRYCMAEAADDVPLAELFEEGAVRQYSYNRVAYDAAWGGLIPRRLRTLADRLTQA